MGRRQPRRLNGGADYVRWIRTSDQAIAAAEFFAANCARVRVSPFLEGVPCSVHAIVLPDGVVVLMPMELISLRRPEDGRFVYAGMGTSWDPAPADAAEMRSLARALGRYLQRTYGYRGAFGVDGVLTADGFVATELNPRFSGGLTRFAAVAPDAQLELVQINALLGRDIADRPSRSRRGTRTAGGEPLCRRGGHVRNPHPGDRASTGARRQAPAGGRRGRARRGRLGAVGTVR